MVTSRDDSPGTGIPTRMIHQKMIAWHEAREDYQQSIGGHFEQVAHENLHEKVSSYYEALRPLISSSNATKDLWNDEKLWRTQPVYVKIGVCPACGANESVKQLNESGLRLGDDCPNCGKAKIEPSQAPATNEDGEVVYHHVEGLKSVDEAWEQRVEREVSYNDALGTHHETRTETQLLAPEYLKAIGRKLDEGLKKLNMHGKSEDKLPKGHLENTHE